MNKHTKLLVSVLFAVIILLAVGITRLYFNVSKDTGNGNVSQTEIVRRTDADADGYMVFESENGLYGILDRSDRIIADPEWIELNFAGRGICTASKRLGGRLLTGCIDYEGNIIVPFVYKNIIRHVADGCEFYSAEADSDGSLIIYDSSFRPVFPDSWDSMEIGGNEVILTKNGGTFTCSVSEDGLVCKKAVIAGKAVRCDFELSVFSRLLLTNLSFSDMRTVTDTVGAYLEFAVSGDSSRLGRLISVSRTGFSELFANEQKITSKRLNDVRDIFIYSERAENGSQNFIVSVTVDAGITYTDETGASRQFDCECDAMLTFKKQQSGITAVSGSFSKDAPVYPQPEPKVPEETVPPESSESAESIPAETAAEQ